MGDGLDGRWGLTVVGGFELGWGGVAGVVGDLAVEASVVEPVDVGHGCELDVVEPTPGALAVDQFPLVEPVERLGEGVVVAVALGADRRDDLAGSEPLRVANRQVLNATVAVMDQPGEVLASALALSPW